MVLFKMKTFTCEATAARLSLAHDQPISVWRRLATRLHLLVCRRCRGYGQHLGTLRAIATQSRLPDAARTRILNAVRHMRP